MQTQLRAFLGVLFLLTFPAFANSDTDPVVPQDSVYSCPWLLGSDYNLHYEQHFGAPTLMFDASDKVREKNVGGLPVIALSGLLKHRDDVLIGFGVPNVFTVYPKGEGEEPGFEKYAAYSVKRKEAENVDLGARGIVQSSVFLRPTNLPEAAKADLRKASRDPKNHTKSWTCVNANCRVWEQAGFTTRDGRPLSEIYFPARMLHVLISEGLYYQGQRIEFEMFRTTPSGLKWFGYRQALAELDTLRRHWLKKHPSWEAYAYPDAFFWRKLEEFLTRGDQRPWLIQTEPRDLTPARAHSLAVSVSRPSLFGTLSGQVLGPHNIYDVQTTDRADLNAFLPKPITAFEKSKNDLFTRFKQQWAFREAHVKWLRKHLIHEMLSPRMMSVADIFRTLPTHTDAAPAKFNLVVTPTNISISFLNGGLSKIMDWIMTKHVLVAGYNPDVRFAGEIFKGIDGRVYITNDSGSYQPTHEQLDAIIAFMTLQFPGIEFVPVYKGGVKPAAPKKSMTERVVAMLQKLRGLDLAMLSQWSMTRTIEHEANYSIGLPVKLSDLASIHPMRGVAEDKVAERAQALIEAKDLILQTGTLTAEMQGRLIASKGKMRGVRDRQGRVVLFDGNGRLKSIREAFGPDADLKVEVEVYEFTTPNAEVLDQLDRIREMRGL